MKHLVSVFVMFACMFSAQAQEETLLSGGLESGGYGGPAVRFSPVKGEFGILVGGYGGWLVNHSLLIGGGGYGLVNEIRAEKTAEDLYSYNGRPLYLNIGYGGLVLEYILAPTRVAHVYASALIGAGGVNYRRSFMNDDGWDPYPGSTFSDTDTFFILEPGLFVELNVTSWFRLSLGGTYRYVTGINHLVGISNSDIGGPSGGITLKFGSF